MLELVPAGVNKWVGMRALLADLARALSRAAPCPARGAGARVLAQSELTPLSRSRLT